MKTFKKQISVLLAVMMILCSFTALSFSASAAEIKKGTITVKSNLCDPVSYDYGEKNSQLQVTYYLQSANKIIDLQAGLTYDSNVLKVASTNTQQTCLPKLSDGNTVINFKRENKVLFNSNSLNLYDFTTKGVFFTVTFDIVGSGNTDVNLNVDVISATTAKRFEDLDTSQEIDLVYYDKIMKDKFTFSAEGKLSSSASTLYVAAPVFKEGTVWEDIYLTYSADSNLSKANKIAMTKTNNLYYSPKDVAGSLSGNTNWPVYKVNLTDEQAAAIDAANYAGFVNTANNISTSYIYSNSIFRANVDKEGYQAAKTSVSALNGKMFVIKGAGTLENKRKFLGSWVSESGSPAVATIYAASPVVNETKSMGDVYFRYGSSSTVSAATQFRMMQTDNWYTSNTTAKMLKAGKWITYSLDLTAEQIAEIDKSNYTGFTSIYGAEVRTRFTYANSVTKACVGSYNSTYNTAITPISKLNGKMFIIEDSINEDTTSYLGYWGDYDTSIRTIIIKAAVPNKVKDKTINSLQLVYSDVYEYSDAKAINMTKTDESFTPEQIHTDLIAPETEWTVYEATIDVSQIREISKVARVGFVSDGYQVNTRYSWSNNILRAGIGTYQNPYDTTTTADLQELDGATFVVCGSAKSTTTKDMIGYWVQ